MYILVLVAGTNEPSNANQLADAFIEGMKQEGIAIEKLRLKDLSIKHFDMEYYKPVCETEDDFCRLQDLLQAAAGVVVATPIWNFSVPGHLKNIVDRIGAFALDEETRSQGQLNGMPCFFLFTGGAPVAAWKGLQRFTTSHLPEAFRYFGGSIAGKHYEGKCMDDRGKFGLVVDRRPQSLEKVRRKGAKFARLAKQIKITGKLPLYYVLLGKAYRLGQRIVSKF